MNEQSTYYDDLITRYLSGELAGEELRLFSEWLKADTKNEEHFKQSLKTWQLVEMNNSSKIDRTTEWNALKAKMQQSEKQEPAKLKVMEGGKDRFRISVQQVWKVAAVALVLLVSSVMLYNYFSGPKNIVVTAQASNIEQVLPDGSVVSLHAGSQLTYPKAFAANLRTVELKGEAYFKVAHDRSKPFVVASGDARVEVLGTQFNVNTQTRSGNMEVVLTSGKVSVYYSDKPQQNVLLNPGEKAELLPSERQIQKSANSNANYMAWKTKILVFDNENLSDVANTLQSVYQTPIKLMGPNLADSKVTASFNGQSLQSVLQVIVQTLDLQMKQNGEEIELSAKRAK